MKKNTIIALIFFIFGILTVVSGGRALFTESGIATRGDIVPLVLWFNFVSGFFYILAGILTLKLAGHVKNLALILAALNALVLMYLFIHIYQGHPYEMRTFAAMIFRAGFWVAFAVYFYRSKMEFTKSCC